jgi:hypothetical protein
MVDLVDVPILHPYRLDDMRERNGIPLVGYLEEERSDHGKGVQARAG